jgi:hypothetical protein
MVPRRTGMASGGRVAAGAVLVLAVSVLVPATVGMAVGADEPAPGTREAVYPYDFYLGDEYPEITAAVPEYGGSFIDHETGTLFVHLTVPSDDLAQRVKELLVEHHYLDGVRVERVAPLPARYSWQQLLEWRAAWRTVEYRAPGITSSGMSGEHNRFEIGVTDLERNLPAVEEVLASVGIPLDAVHLEEESPFVSAPQTDPGWAGWPLVLAGALGVAALGLGVLRRLRRRVVVGVAGGPGPG